MTKYKFVSVSREVVKIYKNKITLANVLMGDQSGTNRRQQAMRSSLVPTRIYSCCNNRRQYRKEGNVLFNDALNTFYLQLDGVRHMVKDHSDSEKGNPLPPHRLLFPINSKGSFICTIPQTGQHIPRSLLHQSWSTGWNEKQLNGSTP